MKYRRKYRLRKRWTLIVPSDDFFTLIADDGTEQAKQPADDLVTAKKEIDAQVEEKKKEAREFEIKMRHKASTVGNIVGKNVPVSLTEVIFHSFERDDAHS